MSDASSSSPSPAALPRSAATMVANGLTMLAVFAALGPPLGWITIFVPMVSYGLWTGAGGSLPPGQLGSNVAFTFTAGMFFSYLLGLPAALVAGCVVVLGQALFRSFRLVHAIAAALVVGAILIWWPPLFTLLFDAWRYNPREPVPLAGVLERWNGATASSVALLWATVSGFCLVPTVACWAIGRLLQRSPIRSAPLC